MARQTSVETYHHIKDNGLLSSMRWLVYDDIFYNGPTTIRETAERLSKKREGIYHNSLSTRFSELREYGAVVELPKRACKITGNYAIEWDVTSKVPVKPPKKISNEEKIKRLSEAHLYLMKFVRNDVKAVARKILKGEK